MKFYEQVFTAYSADVDAQFRLKHSAALRCMQETANLHLEFSDISFKAMREKNIAFLLAKLSLTMHETPTYMEKFKVKTWHKAVKGPVWHRDFILKTDDDVKFGRATTQWVLAELNERRILRPNEFPFDYSEIINPAESGEAISVAKRVPDGLLFVGTREVRYSDLDMNKHMNNAVYADIISDFLPNNSKIERMQLNFVSEAQLGDMIEMYAGEDNGTWNIAGKINEKTCFIAQCQMLAEVE